MVGFTVERVSNVGGAASGEIKDSVDVQRPAMQVHVALLLCHREAVRVAGEWFLFARIRNRIESNRRKRQINRINQIKRSLGILLYPIAI